jgi:hypothetical protein
MNIYVPDLESAVKGMLTIIDYLVSQQFGSFGSVIL